MSWDEFTRKVYRKVSRQNRLRKSQKIKKISEQKIQKKVKVKTASEKSQNKIQKISSKKVSNI